MVLKELGTVGLQEKLIVEVLFVVALLVISGCHWCVCLQDYQCHLHVCPRMTIAGFKQVCMELPKILQVY